jgi:hypothetical protein
MKSLYFILVTLIFIVLVISACGNNTHSLESQSLTSLCISEDIHPINETKINWSHTFTSGIANISANSSNVAVIVREIKPDPVTSSMSPPAISESLSVLQQSDGQLLWQYPTDINSIRPNVIRGLSINEEYIAIFFQLPEPKVLVFSASSGKQVFEEQIDAFEILLTNDKLFLRDVNRALLTYNLVSGQLISKQLANSSRGERGLFYDNGGHVYALFDGSVYIYDAYTGALENKFSVAFAGGTGFFFEGALTGQYLLGAVGNELVYYDIVNGTQLWHSILPNSNGQAAKTTNDLWPPTFSERYVFITTDNYQLHQVSLAVGQVVSLALPSSADQVVTSPLFTRNHLYSIFDDQTLKMLNLDDGKWNSVLESGALRFPGNSAGITFFYPKITAGASNQLFISFGCQTLYAVEP